MAEYIEREALKEKFMEHYSSEYAAALVLALIDNQSSADVAEVRYGKWILEMQPDGKPYCYHCSVCDDDFHYIGITMASDYCPNCGAKMDLEGEE